MLKFIRALSRDDRGVSALEYAILAGVVVAALATVGTVLSGSDGYQSIFNAMFTKISAKIGAL